MKAVNLIPSEQRSGGGSVAGDSDGGAFLVIGLLVGLAVLALLYGIARHQVAGRQSEVASISVQAQATSARASELAPYVSFKSLYQARLKIVSELVGTRFDWAHAFHELGRVLPAGASLSSVHGTIGSATGTSSSSSAAPSTGSATPAGTVPIFSLAGCATSQSEVAETLQRLRLMDGVSAVTLQSSVKSTTGSGGGGSCPPHGPTFAVQVTFSPLPTPAATPGASTTTAAATSGAAATPGAAGSSTGSTAAGSTSGGGT